MNRELNRILIVIHQGPMKIRNVWRLKNQNAGWRRFRTQKEIFQYDRETDKD